MSHSFIQQVQSKSLPNKLRQKVMEETAAAIQNLINDAPEVPGVGKLIAKIEAVDGEVSVSLGVKREPVALFA